MCSSAVVLGCTMATCVIVGLWKILNTKLEKLVARLQHSMMDVFMELLLVTHNHRAEEPLTGKQFVDCGRLTSQRHDTLRTNPQSEHRAQGHKEARAIIGAQTYTRGELIRFPYSVSLSLSAFPCSRHRGAMLHICASHALGHGVIPDMPSRSTHRRAIPRHASSSSGTCDSRRTSSCAPLSSCHLRASSQ